jgi:hypothetical protein
MELLFIISATIAMIWCYTVCGQRMWYDILLKIVLLILSILGAHLIVDHYHLLH